MVELKGKKVLVMGLGSFGGGVGVTKWLVSQGAIVTVTDLKSAKELNSSINELTDSRIKFTLDKHDSKDVKKADLIVVNPAVKPDSPYLKIANKNRIPLTTEINLFLERCPAKVIGVTGTNGKGTVIKMIELILRAGIESRATKIWVGGNIGKSLLEDLPQIKPSDVVILELSSFQLHWLSHIRYSPHIAVITNIAPDHLEWHKTVKNYVGAKSNILRYQTKTDVAVLNWIDKNVKNLKTKGTVVKIKAPARVKLKVSGRHNKVNAAIAAQVARIFGIPLTTSHKLLVTFKGLPNALEYIGERKGVRYYNDSEATTVEATAAALRSFPKKVILIVGGYDKGLPLMPLERLLKKHAKKVYAIGQTGKKIHEALKGKSIHVGTLSRAMEDIKQSAKRGDIVLLSPAASSYDQFKNLQERGESFKRLVLQ